MWQCDLPRHGCFTVESVRLNKKITNAKSAIFGAGNMGVIGNILWFILGGVFMGLGWWLVGILAFISIIGIPWGRACFVIGEFAFFPFGKEAVSRKDLTRQGDIGTGSLGLIGNVIWFVVA